MIKVTSREDFLIELQNFLIPNPYSVEIGVFRGEFAKMILDIINPSVLVLIDPFEENDEWYGEEGNSLRTAYSTFEDLNIVVKKFSTEIVKLNVVIMKGYSYDIVHKCKDHAFDFIYIDASHRYADVKRDLNNWHTKLTINGVMAGHDYSPDPQFGVVQAVDEYCEEQGFEMILLNENGGDWALKRKQ